MVGRVGVVGGSMVDSMVSMVDRGMVDSMVGWGMVDSMVSITKIDVRVGSSSMDGMVDRCSMVDRVVDSMVDSRMGLVDNNRGSNLNLDFARDGFNISNPVRKCLKNWSNNDSGNKNELQNGYFLMKKIEK